MILNMKVQLLQLELKDQKNSIDQRIKNLINELKLKNKYFYLETFINLKFFGIKLKV